MLHVSPFLRYLAISPEYGPAAGLRWANNGEAIETNEGKTFIFTAMLPPFLEGFAAQRPLIHFAFILDLLHLLGHRDEPWEGTGRSSLCRVIREAFRGQGTPLRNAGTFFGGLCKDVPSAQLPGSDDRTLSKWLATARGLMMNGWKNPEQPPLDAYTFREIVCDALAKVSETELRHWFRFGRAPLREEGTRLAEEVVEVKPPTFRGTFDDLVRQRPRLAGALPLVERMVSALALPPRRRTPPELPLGGYADVANRGQPEALLLSQFALDGDEFVRRFAEKELLFFRKEEPHQRTREHLVLLIDQGVRTWGVVRLALSAAALALRKLAGRKKLPFRIRFSSAAGEAIDPAAHDPRALADRLEASDLSANPAELLEAEANANDADGADTDLVLLTHPRNLQDQVVKRAAAALPESARLFALAVDEEGSAQFSELRHGECMPITRFQLNFRDTEQAPVARPTDEQMWTGDVEPAPFPFPIGPFKKIIALDFDFESQHLLVATQRGYLHLWKLDGGKLETLPRGFNGQIALQNVEAVMGVTGGFVVGGRMGGELAAVHYDLRERRVHLYRLGPEAAGSSRWYGFAELGAIAVRQVALCRGLDLKTGGMYAEPERRPNTSARAQEAYLKALAKELPPPWVPTCVEGQTQPMQQSKPIVILLFDREPGEIDLFHRDSQESFRIIEDGNPLSFAIQEYQAQLADTVFAFAFQRKQSRGYFTWRLFDRTSHPKRLLAEYELNSPDIQLCRLSPDGQSFAMPNKRGQIAVQAVGEGASHRLATAPARIHNNMGVQLGKRSLHLVIGRKRHVLSWEHGPLRHRFESIARDETADGEYVALRLGASHPFTSFDPLRFTGFVTVDVEVFVETTGQVIIRDPQRQRLVCIMLPRREQLAIWMPDGTRYGPTDLIGGPATPDALDRLGTALREACAPVEAFTTRAPSSPKTQSPFGNLP